MRCVVTDERLRAISTAPMTIITTPAAMRMYPTVVNAIQSTLTCTANARMAPTAKRNIPNPMLIVGAPFDSKSDSMGAPGIEVPP